MSPKTYLLSYQWERLVSYQSPVTSYQSHLDEFPSFQTYPLKRLSLVDLLALKSHIVTAQIKKR